MDKNTIVPYYYSTLKVIVKQIGIFSATETFVK